ncbi:uncharacterized protein N7515_002858 [Penicillium bovifimosum]|uniref:Uncharacterized protein n=1 Tax=Penicillium bovifimosum TaxID=126998 RepID=A0A9W9HCB7_9EURO|nr:uncharacterized protein N7515_002858 [Penicillium bovifimosum]KAJ5144071.1 hypothetical protein N7515_002858 [Penicillium bovifimosum]
MTTTKTNLSAPGRSFAEMFGGPSPPENIDFAKPLPAETPLLPVPEPTDDLETTARKIAALARIVEQGKSIAVHTGFHYGTHDRRDPEIVARDSMTPLQARQYDAWKAGATMPDIDWSRCHSVKPVPFDISKEDYQDIHWHAYALKAIFRCNYLGTKHALWFTSNMAFAMPLIHAMCKVAAARHSLTGCESPLAEDPRHWFTGGQETLTDDEVSEIRAAHRVVAVKGKHETVLRALRYPLQGYQTLYGYYPRP